MPTYQVVPRSSAISEAPGDQSIDPSRGSPPAERRLESIYQLNPLLPPPSTVPSSVVQQIIPAPSQPLTLYTWPQTRHPEDPHPATLEKTAPPAKSFNRLKNPSHQPGVPLTSPRNSSSQDLQSQQSVQLPGHISPGVPTGGDK
jgi:hypothetical protein